MKKVLIVLVVLIAGFCGFVATRPETFSVVRSSTVTATPEVAYAQVADFHNWKAWSPWEQLDPSMKTTFEGTPGAVGSSYAWVGNKDVGEGRMTITEVKPPNELHIKLEFLKPWEATNTTIFTFKPNGANTDVSWAMTGNKNFGMKAFSMFMDMDKTVGGDFEKGLANLKKVSEDESKKLAAAQPAAPAPTPDAAAAPAGAAPTAAAPTAAAPAPVAGAKPE